MLRTLWQKIKGGAHKNVRFFPLVSIIALIFLAPVALNQHLTPSIAHAFLGLDIPTTAGDWADLILGGLFRGICWAIFSITGMIFVMSGWLFDNAVVYSISGSLYSSFGFINTGWVFIRDLINSLFIFFVLYIAFKHLLSIDNQGVPKDLQKTLTGIVVAALLINFSLFGTKVVIDVSNFLTRAIYYSMESKAEGAEKPSYGPANALASGLNIQNLLKEEQTVDGKEPSNTRMGLIYLGGAGVQIIATIMFFTMAFFFLARILVLVLVMLTSPIYFVGVLFGGEKLTSSISKYSKTWQEALIGQATFPIVFMLIVYIAVTLINSGQMQGTSADASFASGLNGGASGFATIINFGLVIFIMYLAVQASNKTTGHAGDMGKYMAGKVAAAGFSTAAWAGRNTAGRWGASMANSKGAKEWASSDNRFKRFVGDKIAIQGGKAMNESNWDARSSALAPAYGFANKKTHNLNVGKPTTKNAKDNLREFGNINKMTSGGKAKEVAYETKKINKYTNLEARVKETRRRVGDDINNKEYKEYREKLISEIQTEHKEDPKKQKELITELLGNTAYIGSGNAKVRGDIAKVQNKKWFTDSAKEHGKAADEVKAAKAALATAQATPNTPPARITELTAKVDAAEANQSLKAQKFAETSKVVPSSMVRELAVKDIEKLKGQLTTAHLAALSNKMSADEYSDEEAEVLNKMIQEMRMDTGLPEETKTWIKNEAMKGTSGFNLKLNDDIVKILEVIDARTGPATQAEEAKIKELLSIISDRELAALKIEQITHNDLLQHLNPTTVSRYSKRILTSNNQANIDKLEQIAIDIESGHKLTNKRTDEKAQFTAALRGDKIPKLAPITRPTATQPAQSTPLNSNSNYISTSTTATTSTNTSNVQGGQAASPNNSNSNYVQPAVQQQPAVNSPNVQGNQVATPATPQSQTVVYSQPSSQQAASGAVNASVQAPLPNTPITHTYTIPY